jgi:Holliday junction resolvasome RuvABC DNA-binding subunit
VGRFALIKEEEHSSLAAHKEIAQEARQILKRLQYNAKEIEEMIDKALGARPDISTTEDLLNEVYRQKH